MTPATGLTRTADDPAGSSVSRSDLLVGGDLSTRAVGGQILRFSLAIQAMAQQHTPAAGSILVVSNRNDPDLNNAVTDKVVAMWRAHGAPDVRTYQFPVDLRLGHDLTDLQQPDRNAAAVVSAVVYPKLLELIDR
jgi:hypothetical protein